MPEPIRAMTNCKQCSHPNPCMTAVATSFLSEIHFHPQVLWA
jgi:hypothetical protein